MGTFLVSCGISNINLQPNDDVVFFIMHNDIELSPHIFHKPISMPMYGKYNGYGKVTDIETNINYYISEMIFNKFKDDIYDDTRCCSNTFEEITKKLFHSDIKLKNKDFLSFLIIKRDVFDNMISLSDLDINVFNKVLGDIKDMFEKDLQKEKQKIIQQIKKSPHMELSDLQHAILFDNVESSFNNWHAYSNIFINMNKFTIISTHHYVSSSTFEYFKKNLTDKEFKKDLYALLRFLDGFKKTNQFWISRNKVVDMNNEDNNESMIRFYEKNLKSLYSYRQKQMNQNTYKEIMYVGENNTN